VEEVSHLGHVLRVATRGGGDPQAIVRDALGARGVALLDAREMRVTVEDAFVSMVRTESGAGDPS
jgi:hypothetical protein